MKALKQLPVSTPLKRDYTYSGNKLINDKHQKRMKKGKQIVKIKNNNN